MAEYFSFKLGVLCLIIAALISSSKAIIGGKPANIEKYPYQVSIQYNGDHVCGGTIISRYFVLTTAKCIKHMTYVKNVKIVCGTTYFNQGGPAKGQIHQASYIIRHEDFTLNSYGIPVNDIALIKIIGPFSYNSQTKSIDLFSINEDTRGVGHVSGWGQTNQGYYPVSLMSIEVPIIDKLLCKNLFGSRWKVLDSQICAGNYGKNSKDFCDGDYGSHLTVNGKLAGIASWTYRCDQLNYPGIGPGIYTNISYFKDWILNNAIIEH